VSLELLNGEVVNMNLLNNGVDMNSYIKMNSAWFNRVNGKWGRLSNMSNADAVVINALDKNTIRERINNLDSNNIVLNGILDPQKFEFLKNRINRIDLVRFKNTEAFYQAARFPDHPDIQLIIQDGHSGMSSKMKAKKYKNYTRADWHSIRENVMRYCLELKLYQSPPLRRLFLSSNEMPIVEISHNDQFWGTIEEKDEKGGLTGNLIGKNVLGEMWNDIKSNIRLNENSYKTRPTHNIPDFRFFGQEI
jgi:ribA/ribD-fused uncharacterized protein